MRNSMRSTRRQFLASAALSASALAWEWRFLQAAPADQCDVVVYGGTPCGIAAALAAARAGARVLLIEPTRHIGGLSTSGINTAETEHMLKWTIGGIALQFYQALGRRYGTDQPEFYFESSVAEEVYTQLLTDAKVPVHFGARVERVEKNGTRITELILSDGFQIAAKVCIDASYEGDLLARAGVSYAIGRESRDEFGEEAAGVRFDQIPRQARCLDENGRLLPGISGWAKDLSEGAAHRGVMNYNFRLTFAKNPQQQVPIPPPQHYDRARYRLLENWLQEKKGRGEPVKLVDLLDFYSRRNGKFEVNNKQAAVISLGHFGGQFDYPDADYATRDRLIADHWDYTLGLLKFLAEDESVPGRVRGEMKSWGLHAGEFRDNGYLPYQLYVREARRMRGAYVMTQQDVQEDRRKPDSIGLSSHFIDSHHVQRLALSATEFVNEGRIWRMGYAYQIPYRALTPRAGECENLLVPCAASFSHVAYCTLRLESVWMITGHAAGTAAAMAAQEFSPVQSIDVAELQQRLRSQQQVVDFLPGAPEKCAHLNGPPEF